MQNSQPGVEAARLGYGKRPAVAKGSNAGESISHKSRMARALFFRPYAPLMNDPRAVRKLASSYDRRNNVPLAKFSRLSATTWDENVTSVLCDGDVFHGFTVNRLGVFIDEDNFTGTPVVKKFAGRIVKDGRYDVPRLGVLTLSQRSGNSYNFFERGPFGVLDGRVVRALSDRTVYCLYESGNMKASAVVHASGRCWYNEMMCPPYYPPLVAFIAEVAPVKVRPATAAPSPGHATLSRRSYRGFAGSVCPRRRSRQLSPATYTPSPHVCPSWVCDTSQQQLHCKARARTARGCAVSITRSVRQAEDAVANLPLRLGVRAHLRPLRTAGCPVGC